METLETEATKKDINLLRIDYNRIDNPIVRRMIERYDEDSLSGNSCERVSQYNKGNHTKHSKGGGGGCYLATACLKSLGFPEDSLELKAMKLLTRDYILNSFQGKRDYILYGRKAPTIVQAVESRKDSQVIWKKVYERLKDVTVAVFLDDYRKGHEEYKDLVLGLEREFVMSK